MKKCALHNLGCKVNSYETQAMQKMMEDAGYEIVAFGEETADIYIINTCSVTNTADNKSLKIIRHAIRKNKDAIIVVCGCLAQTKKELVDIIEKSIPGFAKKEGHPAKRTFQAIRIEVNNEIEPLHKTVIKSINCLKSGGRLCIITFHSLEDRAVKNAYQDAMGKCTCPPGLPYCVCGKKTLGKIITKKPILPTEEEMKANSRSKSAKLRVFERI